MPVVEVVVAACHVALLVLLGLLLGIQMAYATVHALLEPEVLRVRLHERFRCLCHRYGSVLRLTCGG